MKFSYQQLQSFFKSKPSVEDVYHAFNQMGVEVERQVTEPDGDTVFEVEITPNRPDLYSYIGMAREVAAGLRQVNALQLPEINNTYDQAHSANIDNQLQQPEQCSRYFLRKITGIRMSDSPKAIQALLEKNEIRPINCVVDIINFVMLETGQPMHGADLNKIAEGIIIRQAKQDETFAALDEKTKTLSVEDILICDKDNTHFALGGVIGAKSCEVTHDTQDMVLECAWFDPVAIRQTSKRVATKTDSARRFELGADPTQMQYAMDRATDLILEHTGAKVETTYQHDAFEASSREITLKKSLLHTYLGFTLEDDFIKDTLTNLGFELIQLNEAVIQVRVPSWRLYDVKYDVCIIEELAKVYGYDAIPSTLPKTTLGFTAHDEWLQCQRIVENFFVAQGFHQAINFGFIDEAYTQDNSVQLVKPLNKTLSVMRQSLIPGLIKNYQYNTDFGQEHIKLFEIGRCHFKEKDQLKETRMLAALIGGWMHQPNWKDKSHQADFYDVKSLVCALLSQLGLNESQLHFSQAQNRCQVHLDKTNLGFISLSEPHHFELNLDHIQEHSRLLPASYQAPRRFPSIVRDIALVCEEGFASEQIIQTIRDIGGEWVRSVNLFDVYSGKGIPKGHNSLAFSVEFNAADKTLTNDELNPIMQKIIETIAAQYPVQIRS